MNKSKVFTILLVIFPLLRVYKSPVPYLDFAEFLMLIYIAIYFLSKKLVILRNEAILLIYFLVIAFLFTIIVSFFVPIYLQDISIRFLRTGFYIFILLISSSLINWEFFKKWFTIVALLTSVVIFIQYLIHFYSGIVYYPYINLSLLSTGTIPNLYSGGIIRPASVFLEPAHFAYFTVLAIILLLNSQNVSKRKVILSLLFSASIIISTSTAGLVLISLVWGHFILTQTTFVLLIKRIAIVFIGVSLVGLLVYLISPGAFLYNLEKIKNIQEYGNIRLDSGFEKIELISPINRIIGIGFGNEEYFFKTKFNVDFGYSNSIGYLVTNVGYIGLLLYSIIFFYFIKKAKNGFRISITILLVMHMFSNPISTIYFTLYMLPSLVNRKTPVTMNIMSPNKINGGMSCQVKQSMFITNQN